MTNKILYNFDTDENACALEFDKNLQMEIDLIFRLFEHSEALISQLNRKIKNTDFPDHTIEIFLASNHTAIYNSYDRLRKGYFGLAMEGLRPPIEKIALAMYFFEFPEEEKKYKKNRLSIYEKLKKLGYKSWIDGVMQRIDNEGTKFTKLDASKGQSWYKYLVEILGEESSNFLHANPEYILPVLYAETKSGIDTYVIGPNWVGVDLVKNAFWKITETLLINTMVLDRCFKQYIALNDIVLIRETVEKLNLWQKEWEILVKSKQNS